MERREREALVSPTDETVPLEAERPIAPPSFDEKSIQRARPAVPLNLRGRLGSWSAAAVVLCVLGGVAGGALGGLAINYFQHGPRAAESAQARQEPNAPPVTADAPTSQSNTSTTATNAPNATTGTTADAGTAAPSSTQAGTPPAAVQPASADAGAQGERAAAAENASASKDSAGSDGSGAVEADATTQGELRAALGEWVAATNARDVGRQMNFYAPTVDAFYLSRNASRDAVRAEKSRVFASARDVNVQAAPPEIRLSRDGRTAVMRFRKRYQITGGAGERSGEVLQELRWRRTPKGWKIVSERDLRVLQ
ncbi:MAG TPA: nuclear transport factor 2 family protein [Pyrinomonadaceae bacterium]|nr:nuclear transport factor 2 family protein [Pyrinomonadaceae bacterium]